MKMTPDTRTWAGLREREATIRPCARVSRTLVEQGVLGFGLPVDGKIGVGALPTVEELFVGVTGRCVVAHHLLRAAALEPGQGSDDVSNAKTWIVDQLLELGRGRLAIAKREVCEPSDVGGVNRIN